VKNNKSTSHTISSSIFVGLTGIA